MGAAGVGEPGGTAYDQRFPGQCAAVALARADQPAAAAPAR